MRYTIFVPRLSHSYLHIKKQQIIIKDKKIVFLPTTERLFGVQGASRWSPPCVTLLTKERLGAMQGASRWWARAKSTTSVKVVNLFLV